MALLGAVQYDPSTAVAKATTALLAMTAIDTTNCRITFTAPANGKVLVRLRGCVYGATTLPRILLGILDGSTVKFRMSPMTDCPAVTNTTIQSQECIGIVSGLTPGNSYTWDAAYGVEITVASTNLRYGGPNNTSGANAWGAFVFEVWECSNLLAAVLYDPSSAASKAITSLLAMTAFDTTNARCSFTVPASGKVLWRIHCQTHGSTTFGSILLGVLDGSTVKARVPPVVGTTETSIATSCIGQEASGVISGLTPGASLNYDAAYAVQTVGGASTAIKYGGPNNTTTNDAFGALAFEIWAA